MKLKVFYRGQLIGLLGEDQRTRGRVLFEYEPEWIARGLNLSPLRLEWRTGPQWHDHPVFYNLPGLVYDSLPDAWGMETLARYFSEHGKGPEEISTLAKLAYMGTRAMGALSYQPALNFQEDPAEREALDLAKWDREAHKIQIGSGKKILPQLAKASTAGGQRPKVVVAMRGQMIVYGASVIPEGFEGWIVKLAALKKGSADEGQYGRIEYAYSLMAKDAGINTPETKLLEARINDRNVGLFATRRFDRIPGVGELQKRHMQTLAALQHLNFSESLSCGSLMETVWILTKDIRQAAEAFRRVVFNVAACNCDDHAKNFSFQMDEKGSWTLTPGYDLTYSLGQDRRAIHVMQVNGSASPTKDDLLAEAETHSVDNAEDIIERVCGVVADWPKYAKQAGISTERGKQINQKIKDFGFSKNRLPKKGVHK